MAKLTCYGGAGSTTGANFLLEIEGKKVLIDCGMQQGVGDADVQNRKKFAYDPAVIDYLFITHAHIDHVGLIPKLFKEGFRGEIYSTPETKSIAELLLQDAAKIGREEEQMLYSMDDVIGSFSLWQTLKYHQPKNFFNFKLELYDAGHVLGSALLKVTFAEGTTTLCSGDIGNSPSVLRPDVETAEGLDYLEVESV